MYVREDGIYRTLGEGEQGGQGGVLGLIALQSARPNPSRGLVRLHWAMPKLGLASLKVYDPTGRLVRTLLAAEVKAGRYATSWDGRDNKGRLVAAGPYFVRLRACGQQVTRKAVLQR